MTKQEIIQLVQSKLDAVGHGISFDVVEDGVRQDQDWWYVPVLAARKGADVPREVTVNIYANIEDELEQSRSVNVLFVPVVSESTAS
jgi:hypothetical protein